MCIIVDNDRIGLFLNNPNHEDVKPIYAWLKGKGKVAYSIGDKFATELSESAKMRLTELGRGGMASQYSTLRVEEVAGSLRGKKERITSCDFHVLALALVSGARLLFTGDKDLMTDFKNTTVISKPRGKIYSGVKQKLLLQKSVCRTKKMGRK